MTGDVTPEVLAKRLRTVAELHRQDMAADARETLLAAADLLAPKPPTLRDEVVEAIRETPLRPITDTYERAADAVLAVVRRRIEALCDQASREVAAWSQFDHQPRTATLRPADVLALFDGVEP